MTTLPLLEDKLADTLNDVYNNVSDYVEKDYRSIPIETGIVLLYNADVFVLRAFFHAFLRHHFNTPSIQMRNAVYEDTAYQSSDYHMEFEIDDAMIRFIKSVSKNKPINNHAFIFFLLNFQDASKAQQQGLRRLLDGCAKNSIFVIATTSISKIDQGILSRASIVNIYKMKKHIWNKSTVLSVDQKVKDFLQTSNKLKVVDKILKSRELAYQIYHINYPIERVCHAVIQFFSMATDQNISFKSVEISAKADAQSRLLHKDIFSYEQLLLQAVQLREGMKISRKTKEPDVITTPSLSTLEDIGSAPAAKPKSKTKTKVSIKLKEMKLT